MDCDDGINASIAASKRLRFAPTDEVAHAGWGGVEVTGVVGAVVGVDVAVVVLVGVVLVDCATGKVY